MDSRRNYMQNGVSKATEIIDTFTSTALDSNYESIRGSTTDVSELLTLPDNTRTPSSSQSLPDSGVETFTEAAIGMCCDQFLPNYKYFD